eukprot:jgi/Hompol1/3251/HPOL_005758-RA
MVCTAYFSVLTAVTKASKYSTSDIIQRLIVLIKPMLEASKLGDVATAAGAEQAKFAKCLVSIVSYLLDQIDELIVLAPSDANSMATLKHMFLGIVLIITAQPRLSHSQTTQEHLVGTLLKMLSGSNVPIAVLAVQYSRSLILMTCRAEDSYARIGSSYTRLLLPVSASMINRLGNSLRTSKDNADGVQVLEELMKSLLMLVGNTTDERQSKLRFPIASSH